MIALDDVLGLLLVLVCFAIICAAYAAFTERGRDTDDWFRKRYGGSDARIITSADLTLLYPLTLAECDPNNKPQMTVADIADYAYPPGRRARYTAAGWEKVKLLGIGPWDRRDLDAVDDDTKRD